MHHVVRHWCFIKAVGIRISCSLPNALTLSSQIHSGLSLRQLCLPQIYQTLVRGAKTRATVQLEDFPQKTLKGVLPGFGQEDEGPMYPTVVQQARENMRKHDGCVVLTRVGGFYELYFEQADEYGPMLNLKVAQKKTTAGPVPMAGFPFFQLDRFLKILVQDFGKYVAISEEFANDAADKIKSGGLLFDRKVSRVVTPGTLIDEKFMDPYENNFLLAVSPMDRGSKLEIAKDSVSADIIMDAISPEIASTSVGLAWLDLSTGDFYTQASTIGAMSSMIANISAKEIVIPKDISEAFKNILMGLANEHSLVTYHSAFESSMSLSTWDSMLERPLSTNADFSDVEVAAGNLLLDYVQQRLQGLGIKLQPPIRRLDSETMGIDRNSMRGLEVLETSKDGMRGGKGSLLNAIRRTVTKSGARLLREWIASPSTSLSVINARLDLVSKFLGDLTLREDISNLLRRSHDSQRLLQKFSLGRGGADDLLSLFHTIEATRKISYTLENRIESNQRYRSQEERNDACQAALQDLHKRLSLEGPTVLAARILDAIDEDGLLQSHYNAENENAAVMSLAESVVSAEGSSEDMQAMPKAVQRKTNMRIANPAEGSEAQNISRERDVEEQEAWVMRKSASPTLLSLHNGLAALRREKATLASALRSKLNAQSLTLRWTPGLGYICHVRGPKDLRISLESLPSARSVSSSKSTRSFYLSEWSTLGTRIDQATLQIRYEENRVFQSLRNLVIQNIVNLRRNSAVLDELDIACSFATLAEEQNYVRPTLNLSTTHRIINGRHPTVKLGLQEQGRAFVSNDCFLGDPKRIWLITGPNMAGKSTFLRQNALITILAQAGSFVPAERAEIGIVDRIFSRVGSADNLFRDQSTFMVEMLETAGILKNATPRSFVIMDEVGRGTTPEDGVAVGFACLHHLFFHNQCRTLFATHFHRLADMVEGFVVDEGKGKGVGFYCTDVKDGERGSWTYVHRIKEGVNRRSHALKVAKLAGIPEGAIEVARRVLEPLKVAEGE